MEWAQNSEIFVVPTTHKYIYSTKNGFMPFPAKKNRFDVLAIEMKIIWKCLWILRLCKLSTKQGYNYCQENRMHSPEPFSKSLLKPFMRLKCSAFSFFFFLLLNSCCFQCCWLGVCHSMVDDANRMPLLHQAICFFWSLKCWKDSNVNLAEGSITA